MIYEPTLHFSQEAASDLYKASKWALFLAILGFINVGLMILGAIVFAVGLDFMTQGMEEMMALPSMTFYMAAVYLLMALIVFFPFYYLYRFATRADSGVADRDEHLLARSFGNLKSHYKFVGVMVIIVLCIYIVGMIFAVLGGAGAFGLS